MRADSKTERPQVEAGGMSMSLSDMGGEELLRAPHWKKCVDYHNWQNFIDPQSGGFMRCKDCGLEIDCEGD